MKRNKPIFTLICILLLIGLACNAPIEHEDLDPDDMVNNLIILRGWQTETAQAVAAGNTSSQPLTLPTPEPETTKPISGNVSSPDSESTFSEENEYSVTGTNFGCICSVDTSTMSISLDIDGDQLTYAGNVYNKIADNTYKRTYMGYYINVSGEGENKTTTQVDEERHDIIILTESGFISEHYQGDESSPCCYHTFLLTK